MNKNNLQVGDRVTYEFQDEIRTDLIENLNDIKEFENNEEYILKIERPKYEVIEENEELLTKEEKVLLYDMINNINKFSCVKVKELETSTLEVKFYNDGLLIGEINSDVVFTYLKRKKRYTLKELGLEE